MEMEPVIRMIELTSFLSPIVLTFFVITAGYYLGKIKIHGISLDLAAVLICAVAAGWLISVSPLRDETAYLSSMVGTMKNLSTLGTAIFVSAVGISAGYSLIVFRMKDVLYYIYGGLIVITGFMLVKGISLVDRDISISALLGILCGSLTSTPGMSAACEINGIASEAVTLGYGSAYLFGVIFVVLFVQILTRKKITCKAHPKRMKHGEKEIAFEFLLQIGLTAVIGTLMGQIKIPLGGATVGSSCGMLCVGLVLGFLIRRCIPDAVQSQQTVSLFRNIGLVFFLTGAGLPAGLQLYGAFHLKWLLYGIIFTAVPIITGYVFCRITKYTNERSAVIIAGGMTSTPAAGVLLGKNTDIDLSAYTVAYIGALVTMIIGIRFLF